MASPKVAEDIRDYLVNTTGLSSVSIGGLNPTPINQYAVVEYAGTPNVKTHGGGIAVLDEAVLQIIARHTTMQTAMTNIHTVVDALDGLKNTTINSVFYTYIREISRPRILTKQEEGSVIFIWECAVQARR